MHCEKLTIIIALLCLCGTLLASSETAQQESGPFSGTIGDALWTVITFLALLFVLWKFAWKRLLIGLQEREDHIDKQIRDAEQTSAEAQKVLAEYRRKLENAEDEGRKIIDRHTLKAEQQAKEIVADAREKAESIKVKAEADIVRAKDDAQAELINEAGKIVLRLGEDVIGRALDNEDNQRLIDDAIGKLEARESEESK